MDEIEVQEDGVIEQAWDHRSHRKGVRDGVGITDQSQGSLPPWTLHWSSAQLLGIL